MGRRNMIFIWAPCMIKSTFYVHFVFISSFKFQFALCVCVFFLFFFRNKEKNTLYFHDSKLLVIENEHGFFNIHWSFYDISC